MSEAIAAVLLPFVVALIYFGFVAIGRAAGWHE
jgi:hypothetical protein